jgi:Fe-S oxidoreductase
MTYAEEIGGLGLDVYHISEFLSDQPPIKTSKMFRGAESGKVTYQDPCRLGRFSGVYQQPRDLITWLGYELVEMDHTRSTSICCGTSCWSSCGQVNKGIQTSRLEEASSTVAGLLVTSCLKCQIHLKCAQKTPGGGDSSQLPIRDLTTLVAERV